MRLDSTDYRLIATQSEFAAAAPKARLRMLAEALRMPIPKGFFWNFNFENTRHKCGSEGCALGLAHKLWPATIVNPQLEATDTNLSPFGDPYLIFEIFYTSIPYDKTHEQITPLDVATAIERHLVESV